MRIRLPVLIALPAMILTLSTWPGLAGEPKANSKDAEAIFKRAEAFVEAFHKADAKALAAFWLPDGDYVLQTGGHVKGRAAIEKVFKGLFAENKGLKLRINIAATRFVTPDVAV